MRPIIDLERNKFVNSDTNAPSVRITDATVSQRSQLAQLRPADTNAASIFSIASGEVYAIATILVCNTSVNDVTYRVFHDDDGTTYDESTALFWDADIRSNSTHTIEVYLVMDDSTGNLAVRSSEASALTFTLYGVKFQTI